MSRSLSMKASAAVNSDEIQDLVRSISIVEELQSNNADIDVAFEFI